MINLEQSYFYFFFQTINCLSPLATAALQTHNLHTLRVLRAATLTQGHNANDS